MRAGRQPRAGEDTFPVDRHRPCLPVPRLVPKTTRSAKRDVLERRTGEVAALEDRVEGAEAPEGQPGEADIGQPRTLKADLEIVVGHLEPAACLLAANQPVPAIAALHQLFPKHGQSVQA